MTNPPRLILVGAGAYAEEVMDLCASVGVEVAAWIEGIDPARADPGGRPRILWVGEQAGYEPGLPILPAIGSVKRHALVDRLVSEGRTLATLIHPMSWRAPSATLEAGVVVFPFVPVGARSHVGRGTILSRSSAVGHHTRIGAHCFVAPGAVIAGKITIGDQVHVGIGALLRDGVTIGDGATIGMGAVVTKDVAPGITVVGNPARIFAPAGDRHGGSA